MSAINIQQPYVSGGIRTVNFFNGRLLSGEDLSREQEANRAARMRLGLATGVGIVNGLEVLQPPKNADNEALAVVVKGGLAINALGQSMTLTEDVTLSLNTTLPAPVPASSTGTKTSPFSSAQTVPVQQYRPLEGGVYLLTIAPTFVKDGFSPITGYQNTIGVTSNGYLVEALQFRLFPLTLSSALLSSPARLRNRLAYACFGFLDEEGNTQSTFGPLLQRPRLLDTLSPPLREDVPLALLCWTNSGQMSFIDGWSVRRRVTQPSSTVPWQEVLGDRRQAEAEAMFLQFQDHITSVLESTLAGDVSDATASTISAPQLMSYLPPAGYLPVGTGGFDWRIFLGTLAPQTTTLVDQRLQRLILRNAFYEEPLKVGPFADGFPANEPTVEVFECAEQPGYVFFARPTTGQVSLTVDAQGYQPASTTISLAIGQQTLMTLPLHQKRALVQQRPHSVDVEKIERPVLGKLRLSMVQQPLIPVEQLPSDMIKLDPLPENAVAWLSAWRNWLNEQYPNHGIDSATPAIYIDDYYSPPKGEHIPEECPAYAVFGAYMLPLLLTIAYYITPRPVPLARAGLRALTTDVIDALAAHNIITVDQLAGTWIALVADTTGEDFEYSRYLISDAIHAAQEINSTRSYYEGLDSKVAEILEQMSLSDDVALANADASSLGEELHGRGFAVRLITQAREAVATQHWSLVGLQLTAQQLQALQKIGVTSKGELMKRAETHEGRQELERVLNINRQIVEELHTSAYAQMIASSVATARIKDLTLLPNINAVVANQLAAANINSVEDVANADKRILMEITGFSEDAAEDLKHQAQHARAEGLEVVHLASVTKEVADALNDVLGVRTIDHLADASEEKVEEVFKRFHGDRAVHFVKALFDGIGGARR